MWPHQGAYGFGPCGIGWYIEITGQWLETAPDGRVAAFCNINLYVKIEGEWTKPIPGTGGSLFVDIEKDKQRASDECYKMALTDAISVACKHLGFAADVYWEKGHTKYDAEPDANFAKDVDKKQTTAKAQNRPLICPDCGKEIKGVRLSNGTTVTVDEILEHGKQFDLPRCYRCLKARFKQNE